MRARGWVLGVLGLCATALADPKPEAVDIKPYKAELIVLQDAAGGTYVVRPGKDPKVFYGTAKLLYEQDVTGRSANGDAGTWSINTWAPRIPGIKPGGVMLKEDGSFERWCDNKDNAGLTQVVGDKAKAILDKYSFLTEFTVRRAHLLARDDSGVYYYVDRLTKNHGGKGFRVFVGKKGAMKQLSLTDVASDTEGEVFSTKTGDLRLNSVASNKGVTWIKGEKRVGLTWLDVDANSAVIFSGLGIYKFMGTLCDNI